MRFSTLRWLILIFSFIIGILTVTQLFWLYRVYKNEEKEFNNNVVKSIRGVYDDLELTTFPVRLTTLVDYPEKNTFLFRIDSIPNIDSLRNDLSENLEAFGVFTDYSFTLYDQGSRRILFNEHIPGTGQPISKSVFNKTVYKREYSYIMLYFPNRSSYLLLMMRWWIITSFFLLVLMISLAVSIFYLYRQKFLNEVQNDFIRNVTHEFQTPLTTLTIGIDAVSRNSNDERVAKYLQLMNGQISYLRQHIDNLIRVLKFESSGFAENKTNIVPDELIKDAVNQLSSVIEEKKANIIFKFNAENVSILADKNNLYTAILNLVSNALKFSDHPEIIITTGTIQGAYEISVKDNGVGISHIYQKRLFKKFFRVPTGDLHNTKGLGLGLYLVKKIVKAHNGSIELLSEAEKGAEFIIKIPIN